MQDVALVQGPWSPIGREGVAGVFAGRFYGGGHTISNLRLKRVNVVSGENCVGFFGSIYGTLAYPAWICDVNFVVDTSQELVTGGTTAFSYVGILGRSQMAGIKNVHVRGDVPGRPLIVRHDDPVLSRIRLGGLVGLFYPGNQPGPVALTESSNSLDIVLKYGVFVAGNDETCVGGLVGYAGAGIVNNSINGYIKDSYNDGNITVHFTGGYPATAAANARHLINVGGIVGRSQENYIHIENCYSTGKVIVVHGTIKPDGDPEDDGNGASALGGIVGIDNSGTSLNVRYNYAAGSLIQKGRLTRGQGSLTDENSFLGGVSGWNKMANHAAYNALFMPNILYPPYGVSATVAQRQRVSRYMQSTAQENKAYGAMVVDLYTDRANIIVSGAGRPAGVLNPAGNAIWNKAHGTSSTLDDFKDKATYQVLGWRFEDNAELRAADEPETIPGKHWHWKMLEGSAYPFPVLWWQAKHLDKASTGGISPDTGTKLQWWETSLPAINETWPQHAQWNPTGELKLEIPLPPLP
jgi:hypothetical protein